VKREFAKANIRTGGSAVQRESAVKPPPQADKMQSLSSEGIIPLGSVLPSAKADCVGDFVKLKKLSRRK
jgi:hypothetical protein